MNQPLKKQSGLTFIGLVFVLGTIAMVVLFVLRLFPLYNEKLQVEAAVQTVLNQPDAESMSQADLRRAFLRAISVSNVRRFNASKGQPPMLNMHYQSTNKLFADVQLLIEYDRQFPLDGSAAAN
jgi:hypothetical protein